MTKASANIYRFFLLLQQMSRMHCFVSENMNISDEANYTIEATEAGDAAGVDPVGGGGITPEKLIKVLTGIFVPLAFGLIVLVGIVGNTLVIIVVSTNAQMKTTTNVLILNLAVADLLFIVMCVPFTATDYVLTSWPFGLAWCQMVQYLIYTTSYVSIYTLILMSIDRFMAVVYPVSYGTIEPIKRLFWVYLVVIQVY